MSSGRILPFAVHRIREMPLALAALLLGVPLFLAPLAEGSFIMKRSEVQIAIPKDDEAKPLKDMFVGSRQKESVTEITSVRVKSLPEEGGAEPVKVVWVVTMSNTRPITQVVMLKITLRDEQGERLVTCRGRLSIASSTLDKEYEIKMKLKAGIWQSGSRVELKADWIG